MRVLTRRVHETVRIGSDTIVTIIHLRGDKVRLRVVSPDTAGVYRQEIVEQLNRAAQQALSSAEISA
ncbi:MAG TPA: carbon storage regulator [Steroidobacteraceae bacterium]